MFSIQVICTQNPCDDVIRMAVKAKCQKSLFPFQTEEVFRSYFISEVLVLFLSVYIQ